MGPIVHSVVTTADSLEPTHEEVPANDDGRNDDMAVTQEEFDTMIENNDDKNMEEYGGDTTIIRTILIH